MLFSKSSRVNMLSLESEAKFEHKRLKNDAPSPGHNLWVLCSLSSNFQTISDIFFFESLKSTRMNPIRYITFYALILVVNFWPVGESPSQQKHSFFIKEEMLIDLRLFGKIPNLFYFEVNSPLRVRVSIF